MRRCCTKPPTKGASPATTRRAFRSFRSGLRRALLSVVFTDPQICIVGGGFAAARPAAPVIGEVSFENQGRARVMLRNQGMLHVYADSTTGLFLGAEMIGPDAEHIGHLLAWALQMNLTIEQMLEMPFYHPVVEEGLRTALRDARNKLGVDRQRAPRRLSFARAPVRLRARGSGTPPIPARDAGRARAWCESRPWASAPW